MAQKMNEEHLEYIRVAKKIMQTLYEGKGELLQKYYTEDTECVVPDFKESSKDRHQIVHKGYRLIYQRENIGIVTGSCYAMRGSGVWNGTMVLLHTASGIRIKHIHISECAERKLFRIKDIREQIYHISEQEVLYLEAAGGHVVWHCNHFSVEVVGLLGNVEKTMPESFVRVHRGYIVNSNHIFLIARCYVQMDNGEKIQIPVKKYCEVKRTLERKSKNDSMP